MEFRFVDAHPHRKELHGVRVHAAKTSYWRRWEAQKSGTRAIRLANRPSANSECILERQANDKTLAPSADDAWRRHRAEKKIDRRQPSLATRPPPIPCGLNVSTSGRQLLAFHEAFSLLSSYATGSTLYNDAYAALSLQVGFGNHVWFWDRISDILEYWLLPGSRVMQLAARAAGLLRVQGSVLDHTLASEAQKAHITAVNALRKELSSRPGNLNGILGTALILLSCEGYSLVSSGPSATTAHLAGVMAAIDDKMPHMCDDGVCVFALRKYRLIGLTKSFEARRVLINEQTWLNCSSMQSSGPFEDLMQLAAKLPALLEVAERIHRPCGTSHGELRQTHGQLLSLEDKLVGWLRAYNETGGVPSFHSDSNSDRFQRHASEEVTDFPAAIVPAWEFDSLLQASYHTFCWTCLLLLRQALLNLQHEPAVRTTERDIIADINTMADVLVASIAFFNTSTDTSLNAAVAVKAPLHFASEWFAKCSNAEKLKWCRNTEDTWRKRFCNLQWDNLLAQSFLVLCWLA